MIAPAPEIRLNPLNHHALNVDGDHVVYWMVAHRRTRWNYSLQHAAIIYSCVYRAFESEISSGTNSARGV